MALFNRLLKKINKHISKNVVPRYTFNKISPNDKVIFVYRCDLIGDYVISKDFLRLLRTSKEFSGYKIVFLGNILLTDFILDFDNVYIDEYITFNSDLLKYKQYKKALIKNINKYKYAYVMNYMSIRNKWSEFIISNIKSGVKYGILGLCVHLTPEEKLECDKLYDKLFDVNNEYDLCGLELLECITGDAQGIYNHHYNLKSNKLSEFRRCYNKPYAVIFPSASYELKRMPFEKYLELIEYLHEKYQLNIYICGSKSDKKIFENYDLNQEYVYDLCGSLKLSELPYLFKNAHIILTNDTCAMWIANCVRTNCIIFSNVFEPDIKYLNVTNVDNKRYFQYQRYESLNYIFPEPVYEQLLSYSKVEVYQSLSNVSLENAIFNINKILS